MEHWVQVTSLNGTVDLYESRKQPLKFIFWIFIMALMVALCCYSINSTISDYVNNPSVTRITTVPMQGFPIPDVVICYRGGFKAEMMLNELKLSRELVEFLILTTLETPWNDTLTSTEKELNHVLLRNNLSILEFYQRISYSCEEIILRRLFPMQLGDNQNYRCNNVTKIYIDYYNPYSCLLAKENGIQKWPGFGIPFRLTLQTPNGSLDAVRSRGFALDFSYSYTNPSLKLINLGENSEVDISLKAVKESRIGKCVRRHGFTSSSWYSYCLNSGLKHFCGCVLNVDRVSDNDSTCNTIQYLRCIYQFNSELYPKLDECLDEFKPICHEWKYETSVTSIPKIAKGDRSKTFIKIYTDSIEYTHIEEIETFTWDMALGNVGGIVGLYLGCSVVTFIQALYHLTLNTFERK